MEVLNVKTNNERIKKFKGIRRIRETNPPLEKGDRGLSLFDKSAIFLNSNRDKIAAR
jgi:hypothetical protein